MKPTDLLENRLDELGNAVPAEPTIADTVMSRIQQVPAPSRAEIRWGGRTQILRLTAGFAVCTALLVTIYSVKVDNGPQQDVPPQTGTRSAAVGEQPAVFFSPIDGAYINSKWGFIDKTGRVVIEAKYPWVDDFSEGLAAVKVGGTHFIGGKYGYIDRTGREVIEPHFENAKPFSEGLAAVQIGDKWGCIDQTGEFRIQPRYDFLSGFRERLAIFAEGGRRGYMDRSGKVVIELKDMAPGSLFGEGLAAVAVSRPIGEGESAAEVYGYIDRTGQVVIQPQFRKALAFVEGMAAVKGENGKWGFIDRDGNLVVPPHYDQVEGFQNGLAKVVVRDDTGEKWGVIDKTGAAVIEPRYLYDHGIRYAEKDGTLKGIHWEGPGYGRWPEEDLDVSKARVVDGMIKIWSGPESVPTAGTMKYGFADASGKVVIAPRFEEVGNFSEGLAKFATGLDWSVLEVPRGRSDVSVW
jgi:hypothetical protein